MVFRRNFEFLTTYVAYFYRNSSKSNEKLTPVFFFIATPNVMELLFEGALLLEDTRVQSNLPKGIVFGT